MSPQGGPAPGAGRAEPGVSLVASEHRPQRRGTSGRLRASQDCGMRQMWLGVGRAQCTPSPAPRFLPGLFTSLGAWGLRAACLQLHPLQSHWPFLGPCLWWGSLLRLPEAGCPPAQPGACTGQWSQAGEAPVLGPCLMQGGACRHTWEATDLPRFSISRSRHWWAHELHLGRWGFVVGISPSILWLPW